MKEILTNPNFLCPAFLILAPLLMVLAFWIDCRKNEKIDRKYAEQLSKLMLPGRFILCYRCNSRIFDEWEPVFYLKILKTEGVYAWCERYLPEGKRVCEGEEVNLMDFTALMPKTILTDGEPDGKHSCTVVKRWESAWE